jgi:exodeoxyribonuclease V alpha subunit
MASDLSRRTPWRIARNSIMRALAGILHALLEATCDGHCALPKEALIEQAAKLLEIDVAIVREALERLLLDGELVLK